MIGEIGFVVIGAQIIHLCIPLC